MNEKTIPASGRVDIDIHRFGAQQVGLVKWVPNQVSAKFRALLNRYFYQGELLTSKVIEAVSLPAIKSSGEKLYVQLDTREATATIEISNTSDEQNRIDVLITNAEGIAVMNSSIVLAPNATLHFVLDNFLNSELGLVHLKPSAPIVVNGMQYGRSEFGSLLYTYNVSASEGLGEVLRGSYNTFLEQGCSLIVGNNSENEQKVTVHAIRYDGEQILSGHVLTIPAHGVSDFDVCSNEIFDTYGLVTLQPEFPNSINANIIRRGKEDNYRISIPVR